MSECINNNSNIKIDILLIAHKSNIKTFRPDENSSILISFLVGGKIDTTNGGIN